MSLSATTGAGPVPRVAINGVEVVLGEAEDATVEDAVSILSCRHARHALSLLLSPRPAAAATTATTSGAGAAAAGAAVGTADTPSFINEEDFLALSTAVQGSLDAMNTRLDDKVVALGTRSNVLRPLQDVRNLVSVVLTNRGEPAASSVWKTLYARFWRLAHMPYLTSVEVPPALRQALHLLRFDETVEAARQAHLTEFNAWVFDADHPERERYIDSITFEPAVPLCVPCVMQVRRKADLAALQYAMTWREETVPAGVAVIMDNSTLVGMDSFETMMRGSRSLDAAATGITIDGDAVVVGGRVIRNKALQDRAKAVAREGVRVGWMQASDCVPILIRRQDARNIFAVKRVREGLAKLQFVDAQYWGRKHLPLQTYGNMLAFWLQGAACGTFNNSDLLLMTDLFRSLQLFGETPEMKEDWGVILHKMMASPKTLCKHNISNFGVVGIVAACAGVASITEARQKVLWQEYLRRSIHRRVSKLQLNRKVMTPLGLKEEEAKLTPEEMMRKVQGDIGRANRFVAAVMALARAGVSLLEEAPASPDVLRDLATLFNSNRTAAWTVEAAQGGRLEAAIVATATTAAADGEEEEVTGEEVEVEVVEEAPTGDGGAEESKGGEPGPGVPLQLFPLPPGVTTDTVVPEVALLHILAEEKRYRELPVMPTLADPVLGGAIRKWLDGSETALRKGLVDLLPAPADADVGTSQAALGARIVAAPAPRLAQLARLYNRFMTADQRNEILDALSAAILVDETIVQREELVKALTLPVFGVVPVPVPGVVPAGASVGAAAGTSAAPAEPAPGPATASGGGVFGEDSAAEITGDLAVDFVHCHTFLDTVEAIRDRGERRAATRERVITVAASLLDGRLLADLMLPAVALTPGDHGTGKCEMRVVGDNDAGFARSVSNMLPGPVRSAVEAHIRDRLAALPTSLGPVDEDCTGSRDEVLTALARPLVANPDLGMVVVRALRTANALALVGDKRKFLELVKR